MLPTIPERAVVAQRDSPGDQVGTQRGARWWLTCRAVAARWPDLYGHDAQLYPLSEGLIDEASGPIVYLTIPFNRSDEVSAGAAQMATDHGLVCYDPQWEHLRPAAGHDDRV